MTQNIEKELPWYYQYLESYSHLLLELRINSFEVIEKRVNYINLKLELNNFEGLIFYIYQHNNELRFDVLNYTYEKMHKIKIDILEDIKEKFIKIHISIIPFGQFKSDTLIRLDISDNMTLPILKLYAWSASSLFRNVKSIIKINNFYKEIIPDFHYSIPSYHLENWFKGNETGLLFNLINLLTHFEGENKIQAQLKVDDIKELINKTNEYLFELTEEQSPSDDETHILTELKRLRNNFDLLSKERLKTWIDDIIEFYSKKLE